MTWRTIEAEGTQWEVRAVSTDPTTDHKDEDLLEFRSPEANRPPRRVAGPVPWRDRQTEWP